MYERYRIPMRPTPARAPPVPKFVITRAGNCVNCGKCESACVYGAHKRSEQDPRQMADPISPLCKNCFRCIAECPQRALTMEQGSEYRALGMGIWTPLRITTVWGEAETGKIPVLGAGYRGMFAGPGYDGMWTDMSEIVRPTRDGIHGREFISTSVDIGRKLSYLEFNDSASLRTEVPRLLYVQIPAVMDISRVGVLSNEILMGWARAAKALDTLLIAPAGSLPGDVSAELNSHLAVLYPKGEDVTALAPPNGVRMVEISADESWREDVREFKTRFPEIVLALRVPAARGIEDKVLDFVKVEVDVVHLDYDEDGRELDGPDARHSSDSLRAVHKTLVSRSMRDNITILAGGGVAAAEHLPKMLVCGADAVVLEKALLIALECRDCVKCELGSCPIDISGVDSSWAEGRVTNMVGAWRDQLLEVLGAMGIREVRRLRGEQGRAIFFDDLERETFPQWHGGGPSG